MTRLASYLAALASVAFSSNASAETLRDITAARPQLRRPVAVAQVDESTVVVANRRGRSLSVVDVDKLAVAHEYRLQGNPTDIDVDGRSILVTMTDYPRLAAVSLGESSAKMDWELKLPTYPVSVRISDDGKSASVCCLWARKVVFVRLPDDSLEATPRIIATVALPFAPREQLRLDDSRLLVADAFGGRLAVIDLESHKVSVLHSLPAQNIRGLALSPDGSRVFITHQLLNELSPPRRSEIIWGVMMSDAMRVLRADKLSDPDADVLDGGRFVMIGNGTRGAGDPGNLIVDKQGRAVIAVGGTNEVAVVEPDGITVSRVSAGRRPVAIAAVGDARYIVASELSDTISRIDLQVGAVDDDGAKDSQPEAAAAKRGGSAKYYEKDSKPGKDYGGSGTYGQTAQSSENTRIMTRHLTLGRTPRPGPAERGAEHFFNARLSAGGWYSCHSWRLFPALSTKLDLPGPDGN
ncbi:MAG: hypothetical protein MI757_14205 [Pirellulales bacterium]|nr:hypothetical protein [Pirellulales bacterium]